MKNVKQKLLRDELLRINFLKKELKWILLKSIRNNQQSKPILRNFCQYKIQQFCLKNSRQKNYCLITGRSGGVYKITNTSRHIINKMSLWGSLTNMRANNFK